MPSTDTLRHFFAAIRSRLTEAIEARFLFPAFALILLGGIWTMTLNLIQDDRSRVEHVSNMLAHQLTSTYEAQAVRALREIDQNLKLIKYLYEKHGSPGTLDALRERRLLLPDILFAFSIVDRNGNVVESTRPVTAKNVADREYFKRQVSGNSLWVGRPQVDSKGGVNLFFSRRIENQDGSFAGVVAVSVPAAYFVSGYEEAQLGKRGMMGLLGTDGVFRALRRGEEISGAQAGDYAYLVPKSGEGETRVRLMPLDGIQRYTGVRRLYEFPLAVVVGLSQEEQFAGFYRNTKRNLWTASLRSLFVILFAFLLTRMSWQLDKSRKREVEQRKRTEQDLRIAAAAFESQEAMMVTDAGNVILKVNRAFTETTGYTAEELVGQNPRILKSNRHSEDFYRELWDSVINTGLWQGEIWERRKDGSVYPKWMTISAVRDEMGVVTNYIAAHYDITERKQSEERINQLAFFDQLTGLPNRTLLMDRLGQVMAASIEGNHGALLFIDLDNFKTLNDTLGHHMGDLLLQQVAARLAACVRAGDTVARLGGDEFVVVLSGLSRSKVDAAAQTEAAGNKILSTLNRMYHLKDVEYHSTPSIGATLFLGQQTPIEDLMKQADLAMYRSKASGRNAVCFFDPAMETAVMERVALEEDLRRAIEEKQFLLHYQPQVVGNGRVVGAEALVRWKHPVRGLIPPAEFIPLAEEIGIILPMGRWVLETACIQLAQWDRHPELRHLSVSVNVSVQQFHQQDFVEEVLGILDSTGADPGRLKLELTESLMVSNVGKVIEKMLVLKAQGVGFSLDDFGTGYSSLAYLKRMPLDQLKIDRSFVRDVLSDPNDAAIANTIVALAKTLGLSVIAEGVETELQRDFLTDIGCHAYQGYLFSPPLPSEDFGEFARKSYGGLAAA